MAHKFRTLLKDVYVPVKCYVCKKPIKEKQRFVRLDTFDLIHNDTILTEFVEQNFFHINCWREHLKRMVEGYFKEAAKKMSGIIHSLAPKLKNMLVER